MATKRVHRPQRVKRPDIASIIQSAHRNLLAHTVRTPSRGFGVDTIDTHSLEKMLTPHIMQCSIRDTLAPYLTQCWCPGDLVAGLGGDGVLVLKNQSVSHSVCVCVCVCVCLCEARILHPNLRLRDCATASLAGQSTCHLRTAPASVRPYSCSSARGKNQSHKTSRAQPTPVHKGADSEHRRTGDATSARMKPLDPLEALMSKFDITGQTLAPPPLPVRQDQSAPASLPGKRLTASGSEAASPAAAAPASAPAAATAAHHTKRPGRVPDVKQQLKHALTVNAAHVITHDFMTLSQPLSEGIMLMDRSERRLVMVRSLGELLPLRSYNTEYGNTLERVSKHKARLAGVIELDVPTDEVDWDVTLGRIALSAEAQGGGGTGHPQDAERMATYKAFVASGSSAAAGATTSAAAGGALNGEALSGPRLREKEAVDKMQALQMRMSEIGAPHAATASETQPCAEQPRAALLPVGASESPPPATHIIPPSHITLPSHGLVPRQSAGLRRSRPRRRVSARCASRRTRAQCCCRRGSSGCTSSSPSSRRRTRHCAAASLTWVLPSHVEAWAR